MSDPEIELWELAWLARQPMPVWGGHIKRGESPSRELRSMIHRGLIEPRTITRHRQKFHGYVITDLGRHLATSAGPTPARSPEEM